MIARMKPNNFAMRDWHLEHVEKVILRYINGLSDDASSFEKRNFRKYSRELFQTNRIWYEAWSYCRRGHRSIEEDKTWRFLFWIQTNSGSSTKTWRSWTTVNISQVGHSMVDHNMSLEIIVLYYRKFNTTVFLFNRLN